MAKTSKGTLALAKYREKVEAEDAVVPNFLTPTRMHQSVKAYWKRTRYHVLSLCQAAFRRRIRERNLRISTLLSTIRSYASAYIFPKSDSFDFPEEVKALFQKTLQLRNRLELLRLQHSKLAKQ